MTYTAISAEEFRGKPGSLSVKLNDEFSDIATEFSTKATEIDTASENSVVLGASGASLAASGFDVADGSGGTTYGVFVAPFDMTVSGGFVVMTEAYVKDTDDAVIEIKDNAAEAVTIASVTLDAEGVAAGATADLTIDEASVSAGDILNVDITATAATSGTGHALVVLNYKKV